MDFAKAARMTSKFTRTENGALALNTTGDARLDLYATIGALRDADGERVCRLFSEAYREDPLFATKIAFYARDIRGGLGERKVFRTIIRFLAMYHPEAIRPNLDLIGVYGRYDDMYCLMGTPLENEMWACMKAQFEADREALAKGQAISLLAKWIKTADASSAKTRALGIRTAHELGYDVYTFKRIVRAMRRQIGIVEALMSTGRWDQIKYPEVPSRAMMIYRDAFMRHDAKRFSAFVNKAVNGQEKINSAALYPYDIIMKVMRGWGKANHDPVLEAQWRQLPDYVGEDVNALVIADTSGSMAGRPIATSVGLAIYFAERNKGAFHNLFMSFSGESTIHELKGETLAQKISSINMSDWGWNTNLAAALDHILEIGCKYHVSPDEMPKSLIIISDMEIDSCTSKEWTFYKVAMHKFAACGYAIPNIVFWNVASRHDIFHADKKRMGVQLVSGQSAAMFRNVISCIGMDPITAMEKTINSERYEAVTVEGV